MMVVSTWTDLIPTTWRERQAGLGASSGVDCMSCLPPTGSSDKVYHRMLQPVLWTRGSKSSIGEAIGYALSQWDALTLFLADQHLPVDNNASYANRAA